MTIPKLILMAVCLVFPAVEHRETKVTPLLSQDLADIPDKEGVMITVEYPPGAEDPPPQCTWIYLCPGRVNRDAGEGRKRSDSNNWSDFLRGSRGSSRCRTERQSNQSSEIHRVSGEKQKRPHIRAREVNREPQTRICRSRKSSRNVGPILQANKDHARAPELPRNLAKTVRKISKNGG
jgi:hypothetical protein